MPNVEVTQAGWKFALAALVCYLLYALIVGPMRDLGWRTRSKAELDLADRLVAAGGTREREAAEELRSNVAERVIQLARRKRGLRRTLPEVVEELKFTIFILMTNMLWALSLIIEGIDVSWAAVAWCAVTSLAGIAADKFRARISRSRLVDDDELGKQLDPEVERGNCEEHPNEESHGSPNGGNESSDD